jgi:hypothetical protein
MILQDLRTDVVKALASLACETIALASALEQDGALNVALYQTKHAELLNPEKNLALREMFENMIRPVLRA